MEARTNLLGFQMLPELISPATADHVEVVNGPRPCRLIGNDGFLNIVKKFIIAKRFLTPLLVPFGQESKLNSQNACLDCIQSSVVPFHLVVVLLRLAMVPQHAHFAGHLVIVRCNGARFSACSQVLARIKTEGSRTAHRPSLLPTILFPRKVFRPMGLAGIFKHDQVVPLGQF